LKAFFDGAADLIKTDNRGESVYTADSWQKFIAAYYAARNVLDDANATQELADKVFADLSRAADGLILSPIAGGDDSGGGGTGGGSYSGTGGGGTGGGFKDGGSGNGGTGGTNDAATVKNTTPVEKNMQEENMLPMAPASELPFTDVSIDDWFYDAVQYAYDEGLMIGIGDGVFGSNDSLARAMIVTILYRNNGQPDAGGYENPFGDVPDDAWYADAVKWAARNDIALGYGEGLFGPDDPITHEQLAVFIYREQQSAMNMPKDLPSVYRTFDDVGDISDWALIPVDALNRQGIFIDLQGNRFDPQIPATRAETASILYKWLTTDYYISP
jgi:hypothetical protein